MLSKQSFISDLTKTVQKNCHIADANHAGDYTLCIYLLKMRELYRWEYNKTFSTELTNKTVGLWLRRREELWDKLEAQEFQDIKLDNTSISPFDAESINSNLQPHKLVYSGGMGINNRPHFFLAELDLYEEHSDYMLYIAGKEYARDMSAPPAMSHNNTIYIRKESFQRLLWEKLETWRWNKPDNALGRAFAYYDCDNNLDSALVQMSNAEVDNVIEHERGEIQAGNLLGEAWHDLLFSLPHSKVSIMLRAIRDHLADSLTTLPKLLKVNSAPAWHFYFGNMNNMRKDLYPSLIKAYEKWNESGSLSKMTTLIKNGEQHWLAACTQVLSANNMHSQQNELQNIIESYRL